MTKVQGPQNTYTEMSQSLDANIL